jgi:hypothetical protein
MKTNPTRIGRTGGTGRTDGPEDWQHAQRRHAEQVRQLGGTATATPEQRKSARIRIDFAETIVAVLEELGAVGDLSKQERVAMNALRESVRYATQLGEYVCGHCGQLHKVGENPHR